MKNIKDYDVVLKDIWSATNKTDKSGSFLTISNKENFLWYLYPNDKEKSSKKDKEPPIHLNYLYPLIFNDIYINNHNYAIIKNI